MTFLSKIRTWAGCVVGAALLTVATGGAQAPARPAAKPSRTVAPTPDPRVGLKPGVDDAGVAAKNMELVGHIGKAEGFSDPTGSLNFANSDLAFQRDILFQGNFHGFNFYDVEDPRKPKLRVSIPCPGGQGDMSIYKNLLFMSVEQGNGRIDCGSQGVSAIVSAERFRGVRIFDITNLESPKQIAAVQTCRGSHTHTLVVDPKDKANIYVYGSGTSLVRDPQELAGCSGADANADPNTALFSIDVIQVPLAAPATAKIVNRPRIFADTKTGNPNGLWQGGNMGEGTQTSRVTNQCHDITTYPEMGLAAGACSGNGILLDISDPIHPVRIDAVTDPNFAYWHSATFNNDGTKVIFTDEWGGGTSPRCRATDLPNWGADAIFDIVNRKLEFRGYFKMPAAQTEIENCVAHNGSLIPVPGRDIMVQGWYQGGLSVFDFTDSANPIEIAYFDRGPIDPAKLITAGYWCGYWYNGTIYGSEIGRGLDLFKLKASPELTQNEINAANLVHFDEFNPQHQPRMNWPASFVVARAYLDQLSRTKGISPARVSALKSAIDRADKLKPGSGKNPVLDELTNLSKQLDADANAANPADASRLHTLAATIRVRASELR
jgi:hypothetical protein